ncbi:MAG: class I tRNA ligase family protein [Candidatus Paceibacterota bacterium]
MDKDTNLSTKLETGKSETALREEAVLEFWKENNIFKKSLEKPSSKGEFIFYEGPPTANGKPGIHHLEARAFKDAIPRYKTMRGYHVRRKGGWDTHGLPVELQVEKKLNLDSKLAIEKYGIAKFNQQCKESVWEYTDLWSKFTERMGYFVDQKNAYVTYHNNYIESVWNVLKKVNEQNLLYKDYKVVPWCPRCGTVLSSHELAQGYEDIKDLSVTVKFKIVGKENTFVLAWTTTPWTLPGNVALAVGEKIDYVKINLNGEFLILAKARLSIIEGEYKIIEEMKGKDLLGLEYEPLYPFFQNTISESEKSKLNKAFKVYVADFVTTEDGTGVVHTAVMYGQDDFVLGIQIGLPKHHLVGLDGKFLAGTGFLEGRFVRDEEVAIDIIKDLANRPTGPLLFKKEKYEHSYPHCWRCKTALIYYARDSWYIKMSDEKIKNKMIEENKSINWEPSHIRDGRFGEWLKDIKDWAISRERYWGTPLPVWECASCKKREVLGSLEEIKQKTKKSGNKYFVMRHGEAESNTLNVVSANINFQHHLTKKGVEQIEKELKELEDIKFDLIFSSPLLRTKETVEIVKNKLEINFPTIFDDRLLEFNTGEFDGKSIDEYHTFCPNIIDEFTKRPKGGECENDVKKRVGEFFYEIESRYQNKNILIVSHGDPIWMMFTATNGMNIEQAIEFSKNNYPKNGEVKEINFVPIPHNEDYELDLHRPYIDEINLVCECSGNLIRTKEVMDVWFDSGAMPFAQDHYPFDFAQGKPFENKKLLYPADFICEAIDQTRGWFYTLHAVGVLMGRGKAYKNVICLGHLLDASGKKMSKSLGNIVDPWSMIEKYGVDTLRLWMYSINQPGESKNFDEKTVMELHRQVFGLLYNVLAFYELYRDKDLERREKALPLGSPRQGLKEANVLDEWILAKLDELIKLTTENLDNYKLLEPTRAIRDFIGDLSTWYLRRSRDRIKEGDKEAKYTLYFVLKTLAKIMAPFAPFAAEDIWIKLKTKEDVESVHLCEWPKKQHSFFSFGKPKVLESMGIVREIVTLGLDARQKAGIKVRQPLNRLEIVAGELTNEYLDIIKDELNIKNINYILKTKMGIYKVTLDGKITSELKQEGDYREFVRGVQDMRKKMGLTPSDVISLIIETNDDGKKLIQKFETDLLKVILALKIEFKENNGESLKIDELIFKIQIIK